MRLIALDFETANPLPGSACSFGTAVFENGSLAESEEHLLLPHDSCRFFLPRYTEIHGIRMEDTADQPEFPYFADRLFEILEGGLVLAHNAAFDMNVLKNLCGLYGIACPPIRYFCTCKAARRFWKQLENHRLDTLCRHIGFSFRHHDAREDAVAAGCVFLAMMRESGCSEPEELAERLRIEPGVLSGPGERICRCLPGR